MGLSRLYPALGALLLAGCGATGRVNQGLTVDYDSARGVLTLVADSNFKEPSNPRFDVLPPVEVAIPADPKEMGPVPEAGRLLGMDYDKQELTVYDPSTRGARIIPFTLLEVMEKMHRDDARMAGRKFPEIDRERARIVIYRPRKLQLVTITVRPEQLDLPEETWRWGDEVRYYFKDPSQALRLMNVSKTDIYRAGK